MDTKLGPEELTNDIPNVRKLLSTLTLMALFGLVQLYPLVIFWWARCA